ncbi:uncharacterized protein IL334_003550 [Kwoniella shivajii]|uniref:protein-tyrosine-phosphatase n=1 Tax=Kwoniella shivajii TaxID=564305 RepID=A0ABZ1D0U8_9TREE|nr:hypothetical protein IL334_003550 [Kwoniella shivajii]
MEVEQSYLEGGDGFGNRSDRNGNVKGNGHEVKHDGWTKGSAAMSPTSSAFEFSFPPRSSASTPDRRRQAPPSSIPNFPSAGEVRNPPPAIPFSPSPVQSPMASSPFRSPEPPTPQAGPSTRAPTFNLPLSQPFATPSASGVSSPWLSLAAASGAPTPSLESGPMGRGSPHLGYPFEKLNIGGSWSGGNLWGDDAQGRRSSVDSTGAGGPGSSPIRKHNQLSSPPSIVSLPPRPARGLSNETVLRYKAMASAGPSPVPTPMAKGASYGDRPSSGGAMPQDAGTSQLPAALARRRGSLPKASNGMASLSLPPSRAGKSPSPLASSSSAASSPGSGSGGKRLQPITPNLLLPLLASPATLVLDVRPPSSFQNSHVPSSHSLPVPSTLLRRPAFNLEKLAQMLPPKSTEAVSRWREKGDIVLVDTDSGNVHDGSVLDGLASKFEREGFTGHLWFVKGGHSALCNHQEVRLVAQDENSDAQVENGETPSPSQATLNKGLMAGSLGTLAFQQESTGGRKGRAPPPRGLAIPPTPGFSFQSNPFGLKMPSSTTTERPEPDVGGLNLTHMHSPKKPKFQPANPFFDNIRQNLELSHGGITERIPLNLPEKIMNRVDELPDFLRNLANMPEKDSMDQLAKQFYNLEFSEQQRLQSVMEWHTNGSGTTLNDRAGNETWADRRRNDAQEVQRLTDWTGEEATLQEDYFPFSITAGVERGTKNRYKNIWPYDFSRVRLEQPPDNDSDYINASFIQPRGTSRRYIATQGPLDATFHDFWTLVWEQGVRVIVMITKQFEGGLIKCGKYWEDSSFGALHLKAVSQTGGEDQVQQPTTGFDFGPTAVTPRSSSFPTGKEKNIKRVFRLSNSDHPEEPPRTIVQVQCIGWPDFDVPETPETLFELIKDVDHAVEDSTPQINDDRKNQPPVLVHCSAGVGRTGSFIVVDAILDGLRRELRSRRGSASSAGEQGETRTSSIPSLTLTAGLGSADSGRSKGHDSGKSVSFLSPTISPVQVGSSPNSDMNQFKFTASPSSLTTKITAPTPPLQPLTAAALADRMTEGNYEDSMDVDKPSDTRAEPQGPPRDEKFFQHRGSISSIFSSEGGGDTRRPSLASTRHSSEFLPLEAKLGAEKPGRSQGGSSMILTKSNLRHRTPSPVSEMEDPVASVLEGMRVQRMSLVQSLRQYLFVHRAIIHNYLHILDEEKASEPTRPSPLPTTESSFNSSSSSMDEEGHVKRRASPTELEEIENPLLKREIDKSGGLSKRPSFKKMRQAVDPISASSNSIQNGSPNSPKKAGAGRMRSKSKLSLEENNINQSTNPILSLSPTANTLINPNEKSTTDK